jgi:hypothetical protein
VACDQPFDEVEKDEFIKLMTYARHPTTALKLPSRTGIKHRVMKMGSITVDSIREMFAVHTLICGLASLHTNWSRELKGKSPCLLMRGPQATNMRF